MPSETTLKPILSGDTFSGTVVTAVRAAMQALNASLITALDITPGAVLTAVQEAAVRETLLALEIRARGAMQHYAVPKYDARMIALAVEEHHKDGECEIDEASACVSESDDGGAYVQAWVWVDAPEADSEDGE